MTGLESARARALYPAGLGSTSGLFLIHHVFLYIALGRWLVVGGEIDLFRLMFARSVGLSMVFFVAAGLRAHYLAAIEANP